MAATVQAPAHTQESKKVIAFGGTGKTVALVYAKIGRLLGESANIVVCDFPPSDDLNSVDGKLDQDLAAEGVGQQRRINTLPNSMVAAPNSLVETFRFPQGVADALFSKKQQDTPPSEGLNQEPQVGATVATLKLASDADEIRSKCVSGEPEIFLVAGLGGGTGTGVTPAFARFLRKEAGNSRVHGVFLLPWLDIGDAKAGSVGNAGQRRNASSLVRYLGKHGDDLFDSVVLIGGCANLPPAPDAAGRKPIHPTLILAALYIHMWHAWGGGAHLASRLNRMETLRGGISLGEITGQNGNLREMLVHSLVVERVLRKVVDQHPDERLAMFSLWPLSSPLSWPVTEWLLKKYKEAAGISYGQAWRQMRARLHEMAEQEAARRTWIMQLAADARLFKFTEDEVNAAAASGYPECERAVRGGDRYRSFQIRKREAALEETTACLYGFVKDLALGTLRIGGK